VPKNENNVESLPTDSGQTLKISTTARRISSLFKGTWNGSGGVSTTARSCSTDSGRTWSATLNDGLGGGAGKRNRREEIEHYYNKCLVAVSHSFNIIKAIMMRTVFSLHSLIAIIYVFFVKKDEWYFLNILGVVFMMIEMFVTIVKRKGREPRWFFPCFFIYICTMIPPIWFIELARIDQANQKRRSNATVEIEAPDPVDGFLDLSETLLNDPPLDLKSGLKIVVSDTVFIAKLSHLSSLAVLN
jgi:hypothetical protein